MRKLLYQRQQSAVRLYISNIYTEMRRSSLLTNLNSTYNWRVLVRDENRLYLYLTRKVLVVSVPCSRYNIVLKLCVKFIKCICLMQKESALSSVRLQSLLVEQSPWTVAPSKQIRKTSLCEKPKYYYLCTNNVNEVSFVRLRLVDNEKTILFYFNFLMKGSHTLR